MAVTWLGHVQESWCERVLPRNSSPPRRQHVTNSSDLTASCGLKRGSAVNCSDPTKTPLFVIKVFVFCCGCQDELQCIREQYSYGRGWNLAAKRRLYFWAKFQNEGKKSSGEKDTIAMKQSEMSGQQANSRLKDLRSWVCWPNIYSTVIPATSCPGLTWSTTRPRSSTCKKAAFFKPPTSGHWWHQVPLRGMNTGHDTRALLLTATFWALGKWAQSVWVEKTNRSVTQAGFVWFLYKR